MTRLLTTREVAEHLSCSEASVRRSIDAGDLTALRYGRLIRVHPDDLKTFVSAHMTSRPAARRFRTVRTA